MKCVRDQCNGSTVSYLCCCHCAHCIYLGTYLAKEHVLVGVEGVDHNVEHFVDLGIELVGLGSLRWLVGGGGIIRGGSGGRVVGVNDWHGSNKSSDGASESVILLSSSKTNK